jgi:hypothetical protein
MGDTATTVRRNPVVVAVCAAASGSGPPAGADCSACADPRREPENDDSEFDNKADETVIESLPSRACHQ